MCNIQYQNYLIGCQSNNVGFSLQIFSPIESKLVMHTVKSKKKKIKTGVDLGRSNLNLLKISS